MERKQTKEVYPKSISLGNVKHLSIDAAVVNDAAQRIKRKGRSHAHHNASALVLSAVRCRDLLFRAKQQLLHTPV
jgi:hypothetical protein